MFNFIWIPSYLCLKLTHLFTPPRHLCYACAQQLKNAVCGESILHGLSIDCHMFAVYHTVSCAKYLKPKGAPPHTPLCALKVGRRWRKITISTLVQTLRAACINMGGGIQPKKITRYLRAGGSMELLLRNINVNTTRLIGRCCSEKILR